VTLHRPELLAEPHHQALEVLCARALERGDWTAAYRLADRRCRISPLADAHCFVLRAEALYRLGEKSAAIDDLLEAIHIAPDDVSANRRLLAWGAPSQQASAAKVLVDCDRDVRGQKDAIAVLRACGKTAVASLRVYDDVVEGWAAWRGDAQLRLTMTDGQNRIERLLDADPRHPLSLEFGCAAGFQLRRGPAPQSISVLAGDEVLAAVRSGRDVQPAIPTPRARRPDDASVTVIVPVYGDYGATKLCLDSLLAHFAPSRHRLIVVNDASPDPRIHAMLAELVGRRNVRVLTNSSNLGFVGAVNRALGEVEQGDVLLLNADTVVPEGFIERLGAAAQSAPDIATVTPLSNNGEFTSFPVPNRPNPIDGLDITEIDRVAAAVNAGRIVDIPNGIGFCLYITRACLDAVGRLSDSYCRGYLEDVDFCLRARQHGLRNVCATSVYVGHAGSRSFGEHKRPLVVRNLKIVEQRFPTYRVECADFMRADPLRSARQVIEASLIAARPGGMLLVTGDGAVAEVARARARRLAREDARPVLVLDVQYRADRIVARLRGSDDAAPQSIDLALPMESDALLRTLRQLGLSRIELFDLARLPRALVEGLRTLRVPYDLFLAHTDLGLDDVSVKVPASNESQAPFWRGILAGAEHVLVPEAAAEWFAGTLGRGGIKQLSNAAPRRRPRVRGVVRRVCRVGLVAVRGCAQEHNLMRAMTMRLARAGLDIVVVGSTHDELALMRAGAFVTGTVSAAELMQLCRWYGLERLVVCMTRPLFGHPIVESVASCPIPAASFDWTNGECPSRQEDLALNPSLSIDEIIGALLAWLGRSPLP
jgi:GT2 family glycosyltransferase